MKVQEEVVKIGSPRDDTRTRGGRGGGGGESEESLMQNGCAEGDEMKSHGLR